MRIVHRQLSVCLLISLVMLILNSFLVQIYWVYHGRVIIMDLLIYALYSIRLVIGSHLMFKLDVGLHVQVFVGYVVRQNRWWFLHLFVLDTLLRHGIDSIFKWKILLVAKHLPIVFKVILRLRILNVVLIQLKLLIS